MNKKTWIHCLSFIGLFSTFGIAYGLDRWIEYLRQLNSISLYPPYLFWSWSLANIILAICTLSLYTWAMPKLDSWAIWCIVILGLSISFLPVLYSLPLGFSTHFMTGLITNRGYLLIVGGFTAIAGVFTLFKIKEKK